jgi:pyridoxal phosphate enzyme (YggS family)
VNVPDEDVHDATTSIAARLAAVTRRIELATTRRDATLAGAAPPRLVAVAKKHPPEAIRAAFAAGQHDLGENYAQEFVHKHETLADLPIRWHFIGALQSNKVKLAVGRAALIHTLDRTSLLHAIEARASALDLVQDTLVEVNLGGEAQKAGVAPDGPNGLEALLEAALACPHVAIRGLMLIPPASEDPEQTRPFFRQLRTLRDALAPAWHARSDGRIDLKELSMGMSDDVEVAIEEGATIVRVGTAIFGPRQGSTAPAAQDDGSLGSPR